MNDTAALPQPKDRSGRRTRSGSETRQRGGVIPFRVSATERAEIEAAADRAGLTLGSYVRARILTRPTTRATRSPPTNKAALARLLGEIGRVGSNINQIARQLNSGRDADEIADLALALRAVWEMRDAVLLELGMKAAADRRPATVARA